MNSKEIHYFKSDKNSDYNFEIIKSNFLSSIDESSKNVISNVTKRFPKDSDDNVLGSVFSFIGKIQGILTSSKYIVCVERNDDNFRAILILYSIISNKFMLQDKIDISDCPSMLALCQDNWIVANCSTPANYFHILRRQVHRDFRKPLVLMTPKSLLRHKLCTSKIDDFTNGSSFHRVLWDDAEKGNSTTNLVKDKEIKRVVMCSGKVYFDLLEERDARGINDIYLLRFEQFYPFPAMSVVKELERFQNAEMIWCQEEPKNQGAWSFMEPNIEWVLSRMNAKFKRPIFVGRPASASPATGLASQHKEQQKLLVDEALNLEETKK